MKFDDIWPHLESLAESEVDALFKLARKNVRYRLEFFGVFFGLLGILVSIGYFGSSAIIRTFHPGIPIRIIMALLYLSAIWFSGRALVSIGNSLFYRSVMRELHTNSNSRVT